jgi:hypothetical protein
MSIFQKIIFSIFFLSILLSILIYIYKYCNGYKLLMIPDVELLSTNLKKPANSTCIFNLLTAITKLAIAMFYFYGCDR